MKPKFEDLERAKGALFTLASLMTHLDFMSGVLVGKSILIISDEFPPSGGGAGVVAKRLATDLVSLGCEVTLVTGDHNIESVPGVSHFQVKRKTLIWPFSYKRTFNGLDFNQFDLIILNDYISAYLAGLLFSKEVLFRCVPIIHGDDSNFFFNKSSRKHKIFRYASKYKKMLEQCGHIVTVSEYAKELFIHNVPFLIDERKVSFSYAGISADDFDLGKSIAREELGIPSDGKIMFTACRIVEEKGIFTQLDLFSEQVDRRKDLYWLVAGDGVDRARFEQEIDRKGLKDRVILLGRIKRTDLAMYYKLADVFWMLSARRAETMGLVYLEAALFGTPSIGYAKYGVKEAIDPGKSGFFYNPKTFESDLDFYLDNDLSAGCYEHITKFSSEKFSQHLVSLIQNSNE